MVRTDIETVVREFKEKSAPSDRYTSFDYCFNYFSSKEKATEDVEKSCLMLGFYLASWGMFRGSSFLLQKSVKCFEPTVRYFSELDRSVWHIDVDGYSDSNIQTIVDIYKDVRGCLIKDGNADLVLITKILLGVFGFVPAYDRYFATTFRELSGGSCGFRRVNKDSLRFIRDFYEANREVIDVLASETFTTDFQSGQKTTRNYPKAKIIDMYGFTKGIRI